MWPRRWDAVVPHLDRLPLEAQAPEPYPRLGLPLHVLEEVAHHRGRDDEPDVLSVLQRLERDAHYLRSPRQRTTMRAGARSRGPPPRQAQHTYHAVVERWTARVARVDRRVNLDRKEADIGDRVLVQVHARHDASGHRDVVATSRVPHDRDTRLQLG